MYLKKFFLQQFKSVFSFSFQFKPIFSSLDPGAGCVLMDLQNNYTAILGCYIYICVCVYVYVYIYIYIYIYIYDI